MSGVPQGSVLGPPPLCYLRSPPWFRSHRASPAQVKHSFTLPPPSCSSCPHELQWQFSPRSSVPLRPPPYHWLPSQPHISFLHSPHLPLHFPRWSSGSCCPWGFWKKTPMTEVRNTIINSRFIFFLPRTLCGPHINSICTIFVPVSRGRGGFSTVTKPSVNLTSFSENSRATQKWT